MAFEDIKPAANKYGAWLFVFALDEIFLFQTCFSYSLKPHFNRERSRNGRKSFPSWLVKLLQWFFPFLTIFTTISEAYATGWKGSSWGGIFREQWQSVRIVSALSVNKIPEMDFGIFFRAKFGFHIPPFNSIDHLHLHCILLPFLPWCSLKSL